MRALVVSNMWPTTERPALGTFVKDQVEALQRRGDVELDLLTFAPGAPNYLRVVPRLARKRSYDVVHSHFGLTAVPALAAGGKIRGVTLHGTDLIAPRSRSVTLAVLARHDVVGVPSEHALALLPADVARRAELLPCGIDVRNFTPLGRREARRALGLNPDEPFVLFPYDRAREVKRFDRAQLAAGDHRLISLGHETRERMRLWMCAASVVVCPADWETFGMAAVEAVACGTSVVATPTGVHAEVLEPLPWAACTEFDAPAWRAFIDRQIAADHDTHPNGPMQAAKWSSDLMAERLVDSWRAALQRGRGARR